MSVAETTAAFFYTPASAAFTYGQRTRIEARVDFWGHMCRCSCTRPPAAGDFEFVVRRCSNSACCETHPLAIAFRAHLSSRKSPFMSLCCFYFVVVNKKYLVRSKNPHKFPSFRRERFVMRERDRKQEHQKGMRAAVNK